MLIRHDKSIVYDEDVAGSKLFSGQLASAAGPYNSKGLRRCISGSVECPAECIGVGKMIPASPPCSK